LETDSSEMQKADILLALDLVGAKAGPSPPAIGAEEALAAYWRQICQEFRDVLRLLCTREGLCRDGDTTFEGLPWGGTAINGDLKLNAVLGASSLPCALGGGSKAAAALARKVPVSKRYMDRQQQKAAALKSCMMSTSKWSRSEKQ